MDLGWARISLAALGLLLTKPKADRYSTHREQLLVVSAAELQHKVRAGPESLHVATVRCVWEPEVNGAAGARRTLWSTDPAWATAVPAPWAPKRLLVIYSAEGRRWTGDTPGEGTAALALGECEDVCRERAGQHS